MKLEFHPAVGRDLRKITAYYDENSLTATDRFLDEFRAALDGIRENPTRHHLVDSDRRRCNLKRFPYHLIYEIQEDVVYILVVRHHSRHPDYGMRRSWQ